MRRPARRGSLLTPATLIAITITITITIDAGAASPNPTWPQWRGPEGQGHASATRLPLHWSETNHIAWKTPIPGRGWSSPVIEGDQIWMTTAFETPAKPEDRERRLKADTANQPLTVLEEVRFEAIGVDRRSGRILHRIPLLAEHEPQWAHELNSYASPTPVLEDGRLYCHFGSFGTACVDTRKAVVLWTNISLRVMHENGPGSSPVPWRNLLIFHMDGSDEQYVAALDRATGRLAWKTPRSGAMHPDPQFKKAYSTPIIIDVGGQPQLVSPGANWLYFYDPATGRELAKLNFGVLGFSISPRPVSGHGMVYLSTGFMKPELLAVQVGPGKKPSIAWRYRQGVSTVPSPLLVGDELYFVSDSGGILTCLDARTGREHYRERLGGNFSSSPLSADGRIYCSNREGVTSIVAPGPAFKLLATNALAGKHFASPAAIENALYLRTDHALYRVQEKHNRD